MPAAEKKTGTAYDLSAEEMINRLARGREVSPTEETLSAVETALTEAPLEKKIAPLLLEASNRLREENNSEDELNNVYGELLGLLAVWSVKNRRIQKAEYASLARAFFHIAKILVVPEYKKHFTLEALMALAKAGDVAMFAPEQKTA